MEQLDKDELAFLAYLSDYVTPHKKALIDKVLGERTRYITLVLENIYKPHNASAVLRTADCFGIQDVHVIEGDNSYDINPYVTRGAAQWVDLHKYDNASGNATEDCIKQLKHNGYKVVVTSPREGSLPVSDLPIDQPLALIFGNEHEGVSQAAMEAADGLVHIPMKGFTESFNISVSAAICLYALQEKIGGESMDNYSLNEEEKLKLKYRWYQEIVKHSAAHKRAFFHNRK
ncbi:TrmH family RNA methyltransferase [Cyclobacterium marinum]|uniref:tRNA (guanosine(18)-2'-O)-methyltransferase n=1 Tax=Cyclobacterium marinum (strain ATCC 25205 / DSM 745 / LMG 13164 / NCIMB 1802) TaxID=880070 RepID=G0J698_CYCMS|nr:RNA methyltransferase [Cyclobacterium marinum]AEL26850.1 tRNA/rRNA methyltransferase (SpoU) [Cyclobacterium marinum DSM 745]